jgi:hypothetical protein
MPVFKGTIRTSLWNNVKFMCVCLVSFRRVVLAETRSAAKFHAAI